MSAWRVVAAAAPGATHAERGLGSSDAHRFEPHGNGVALLVADGLGSAAEAALASRMAVAAAAADLRKRGAAGDLTEQRAGAVAAVERAAAALLALTAQGFAEDQLGTTLLVCTATSAGIAFAGVGDGFLGVRTTDAHGAGHHLLRLEPPSPIANETATLLAAAAVPSFALADPAVDGLLLATDGLEAAAIEAPLSGRARLRAGVADVLLRHGDGATDSLAFQRDLCNPGWDSSSSDDRSVVMAVRT